MVKIGHIELNEFPVLLAPMEDVSDPPFRLVCKQNGADVMYTEFISSEGLIRHAVKSVRKLDIYEEERPIAIQFFGGDAETMANCVEIIEGAQPDFIDINFGCPVKGVACRGAGAGILRDIPNMVKITSEIIKRAHMPVTIKTRLGWDDDSINVLEVVERMQDIGVAAITIHARTRAQMYKGHANWSWFARIKDSGKLNIPLFGNGDITSPEIAQHVKDTYGVDGVMIGRAAIGNPWIFNAIKHYLKTGENLPLPTIAQRVAVAKTHLHRSIEWKGERVGVMEMRSHYSNYFKGLPGIKEYRDRLVRLDNPTDVEEVLDDLYAHYSAMADTVLV
jgi:nifR3 family TIM-barrel protein